MTDPTAAGPRRVSSAIRPKRPRHRLRYKSARPWPNGLNRTTVFSTRKGRNSTSGGTRTGWLINSTNEMKHILVDGALENKEKDGRKDCTNQQTLASLLAYDRLATSSVEARTTTTRTSGTRKETQRMARSSPQTGCDRPGYVPSLDRPAKTSRAQQFATVGSMLCSLAL